MVIRPWQEISRKTVLSRMHNRGIIDIKYILPNDKEETFRILDRVNIVTVFGLTEDNKVILLRQNAAGLNRPVIGLPGGEIKEEEIIQIAAAREFLEETGFSGKVEVVTYIYQGLYRNGKSYCAVATDCEQIAERNLDPMEFLETMFVSIKKLKGMLLAGEIKSDVGMMYLCLHHLNLL